MSEFTKLATRVEHVLTSATALRERYVDAPSSSATTSPVDDHAAAQALHDEVTTTLLPAVDKFHSKLHAVDPVTGVERFGPQMKTKIVGLTEQAQAAAAACAAALETIAPWAARAKEEHAAKEAAEAAHAAAAEQAAAVAAASAAAEMSAAAAATAAASAQASAEQRGQRRLAEEARCRRRHLAAVLQRLLTQLNDTRPRGPAAVAAALARLRAACPDPPTLRAALRTALTILEGISARPDNALLRRLRLFHADLHGRLLRHDGGVALLLAVGFHVKYVQSFTF